MSRASKQNQSEESIVEIIKRRVVELRRRLNDAKGEWMRISEDTAINHSTIYRIASGKNENPEPQTVQTLLDWLDASDKASKTMREELKAARA